MPQNNPLQVYNPTWSRLLDAVCIVGAHLLLSLVYTGEFTHLQLTGTILAVLFFDFAGQVAGVSSGIRGEPLFAESGRVSLVWLVVAALLIAGAFAAKAGQDLSRVVTISWLLLAPTAMSLWRLVARSALRQLRCHGFHTRRTAILGATEVGARLAHQMHQSDWMGMYLVGFWDDRADDRCHADCGRYAPHRGDLEDLLRAARNGEFEVLYIALPLRAEPRVQEMVRRLADTTVTVYMAADFYTFNLLSARWSSVGSVPVVGIHETPFSGGAALLKRSQDIFLGAVILLIIALPMLFIALAVKLTSRGPVFFRQRRYGLQGEVIHVLKFRSMNVCEDGVDVQQATRDDRRLTRIGGLLRRTSLDELPQFLNVLSGEMSIVGPRPHAVAHNELYRGQIQGYMLRHKVKPGITGWAQVNGWRGETDTLEKMERRIAYDLEYIRNWSLLLDLRIIARTAFGSARKNAY